MRLPNPAHAVVDLQKLLSYCLNPAHPRGGSKARVFAAALDVTIQDTGLLRQKLLDAAHSLEATLGKKDGYGQRYVIDFPMDGPNGKATVRSCWIVRANEDFPRLTSCYVL